MGTQATVFDADMAIASAILLAAYALIFSELLHRTSAAIVGAVTMVVVGITRGFYTQEAALRAIDANTILLLMGMMMMVSILRPTGFFDYAAVRVTKAAAGDPRLLLVYLGLAATLISMVLDNVTTIIIFAPLTVLITRILSLNPLPFLISEAVLSNIGGTATLVGDPPNIMIGSASGIDFNRFLIHLGPPILAVWVVTTLLLLVLFRKHLRPGGIAGAIDLDEGRAITNAPGLKRSLLALTVIVTLFFLHHRLDISPALAAFIGLALALAMVRPSPEKLLGQMNWSVLLFFTALFVIVGGLQGSGLLHLLGLELASLAQNPSMLLTTALMLMWTAALLSSVVDNIPFTVTMIPIIVGLELEGANATPLWWALALGVGLGGNGTHVGATANIIVVTESEACGIPAARITPMKWLRYGLPATFFSLLTASVIFVVFFEFFL